jgi:hypothetical protein
MTKKIKVKASKFQLLLSVLIWVLILAIPVFFDKNENGMNWVHIFQVWKENSFILLIFLINRFILLPQLFFKGKRAVYIITITGVILMSSVVLLMQNGLPPKDLPRTEYQRLEPKPLPPLPPKKGNNIPPFANFLVRSILIIGFDTGLVFYMKWMQAEQNKIQLEKENVENKLAFLQNQISPHFFLNTLNNIHALIDINTEEAKQAIIKLSEMMNYMLYESQSDSIPLQREMAFIKSYVDLMKLRFTDEVDVLLEFPEYMPNINIPPLLTISFIENAFKHGISYDAPSFIHIQFMVKDKQLQCSIRNSDHAKTVGNENSGIGIRNAKSRLSLLYQNQYQLAIHQDKGKTFEVQLNIPL